MHPNTISVNTTNNNHTNYITTQTWFFHPLSFSHLFLSSSWFFFSLLSSPWNPVTRILSTRLSGHETRRGNLREQGLIWGRLANQQSTQFRHLKFIMVQLWLCLFFGMRFVIFLVFLSLKQSPDGDVIECVPSHLQPAFDHPLLKGQKPLVLYLHNLLLFNQCQTLFTTNNSKFVA